mgnify:CR=1 FL=1
MSLRCVRAEIADKQLYQLNEMISNTYHSFIVILLVVAYLPAFGLLAPYLERA